MALALVVLRMSRSFTFHRVIRLASKRVSEDADEGTSFSLGLSGGGERTGVRSNAGTGPSLTPMVSSTLAEFCSFICILLHFIISFYITDITAPSGGESYSYTRKPAAKKLEKKEAQVAPLLYYMPSYNAVWPDVSTAGSNTTGTTSGKCTSATRTDGQNQSAEAGRQKEPNINSSGHHYGRSLQSLVDCRESHANSGSADPKSSSQELKSKSEMHIPFGAGRA